MDAGARLVHGNSSIGSTQRLGTRHRSPPTDTVAVLRGIHRVGNRVFRPGDHRECRRCERCCRHQHDGREVVHHHLHRARRHLAPPLTARHAGSLVSMTRPFSRQSDCPRLLGDTFWNGNPGVPSFVRSGIRMSRVRTEHGLTSSYQSPLRPLFAHSMFTVDVIRVRGRFNDKQ